MQHSEDMWVIGDIHGARESFIRLLKHNAVIDDDLHWRQGALSGICIGDYVNKGIDGAGVIQLIRRLQNEASAHGAQIEALLGNHDVLMYGVLLERKIVPYGEMAGSWLLNGGRFLDLEAFERDAGVEEWLQHLPAIVKRGDTLFIHSDSMIYCELGTSIEEVNEQIGKIMRGGNLEQIAHLFTQLCRRQELNDRANLEKMLATFDAKRVVHGHTPKLGSAPEITHSGRCINVEGGLWMGEEEDDAGLGFLYMMSSM